MKLQYDYYTKTSGFPEVRIDRKTALDICERMGFSRMESFEKLHDPDFGMMVFGDRGEIKVWAEEAMNYNSRLN